jgi:trk system potassium uptake protein TrkH
MKPAPGLLATVLDRTLAVVLFFASVVPILLEEGGVRLSPGALPWIRGSNILFAALYGFLEWRRLRAADYRWSFLREEAVDYALLAGTALVMVEELLTGGGIFGLAGMAALVGPAKGYIVVHLVLRIVRLFRLVGQARVDFSKAFLVSFLVVIGVGALLLGALPGAVRPGKSVSAVDALFTSVSAVCVTGLTVVDTGTTWSRFGQTVILILIQIGGLGLMTFAAFFAMAFGKGIGFTDRIMLREMLNVDPLHSLGRILAGVVTLTFSVEGAGALVMYGRFHDPVLGTPLPPAEQVWYAAFHSVSAFCNAGFSLYPDNWMPFVGDTLMSGTVMVLVVTGGLGFTVLLNLLGLTGALVHSVRSRLRNRPMTEEEELEAERREPPRVSLQTKVALTMTALLVLGGAALIYVFEARGALEGRTRGEAILASLFQSVATRTAGYNTLDTASLQPVTLTLMLLLMFIGASPGSTGGGIKTVTTAVLYRSVTALARGRSRVEMGNRSLPPEVSSQAVVVVVMSIAAIFVGVLVLTVSEGHLLRGERALVNSPFLSVVFEAVSAFGTVGLSAGLTGGLTASFSVLGKCVLMGLMFFGRVGPLSLVIAMGRRQASPYEYPDERVMIG